MDNGSGSGGPSKDQTHTKPATPIESDKEQKRNLAYLVVLAGVSAGEMFKLQVDKTIIGRGPRCAVRLNDEGVSREHCQLVREGEKAEGEKMILEDLGSTNGTFCNGIRVDRRELADGDKIMVGSTTILKFTYHDYLDEVFQRQMYESALRDDASPRCSTRSTSLRLPREGVRVRGAPRPRRFALIFLDIDYFKRINDTHGHPAGDFVLSELSQLMATLVRTEDDARAIRGRGVYGALTRHLSRGREDRRRALSAASSKAHTFSFGVQDDPRDDQPRHRFPIPDTAVTDHAQLLAASDKALYEAKRTGRNRVTVHGTESTPKPEETCGARPAARPEITSSRTLRVPRPRSLAPVRGEAALRSGWCVDLAERVAG